MANLGQPPRPGGEPPPRRQLTPEERRVRETFNRAEHLARNGAPAPAQTGSSTEVKAFDEVAVRAALSQEGLDFTYQIFPIGETPPDPAGRNQQREGRITELEKERVVMINRMRVAEQAAADAIREVRELTIERDTLRGELGTLKSSQSQEAV